MRSALERAAHHARAYLATLDTGPVATTASRQELLSRLDVPLTRQGVAADVVVDELAAASDGGLLGSGSGRFFAWVIGGALPSAVATEWLMSAWDQNAAIYATSPVSAVVEEVAGNTRLTEAGVLLFDHHGRVEIGERMGLPDVLTGYAPNNFQFTSAEFGPASGPSLDPGGGLQTASLRGGNCEKQG